MPRDTYLMTYWTTEDPYEAEGKYHEAAKNLTKWGNGSTRYAKIERKRGAILVNIYERGTK